MKDRIKQVRKYQKLTQTAFGDILGVKGNTITGYETGTRNPTDTVIKSICREFGVNEEWLRTGEGEMLKNEDKDFGAICAEIGANDENAKNALLKYAELTPEDKKLFWDFVEKFLK